MTVVSQGPPGHVDGVSQPGRDSSLVQPEHLLPACDRRPEDTSGEWRVRVHVGDHSISRSVWYKGAPWSASAHPTASAEVIWPTWPTSTAEEATASQTPLQGLQTRWDATISRLRDSAKWMATVLGAALASVIPAAPLAHLTARHFTTAPAALGIIGLLLLNITLLLVLQVMRPQTISYSDVQNAALPRGLGKILRAAVRLRWHDSHAFECALYRWQHTIEAQPDLYLPCGVYCLTDLRQLLTVEEVTLMALSKARECAVSEDESANVSEAQSARAAKLHEFRQAAAMVVTVGTYYKVRARSTAATCFASTLGVMGVVAIIAAIAWQS